MKVYIVTVTYKQDYCGDDKVIVNVFADEQDAIEFTKERQEENGVYGRTEYDYEEYKVN